MSCSKHVLSDAKQGVQICTPNHTQKNLTGKVIAAAYWFVNGLLGSFKEVKVKAKCLVCHRAAGQPRGRCPPQEDGRPIETHHALLFSTPLHFLNKGRKQGRARIVQPSAKLFDRMQCSAGNPRQSVSRGPLSAQYSTVPDFQISIWIAVYSFIFMKLMQYLWCSFHLMIWSVEILLVGINPCGFISCVIFMPKYLRKYTNFKVCCCLVCKGQCFP